MAGVVFVIGLCALAFVVGCLLTAVALKRDRGRGQPPRPAPAPPPADPYRPMVDVRRLPEDYATKPIHRNPVMGIPTALPPSEPARPTLSLVPDPEPDPEPEEPVRQGEVRHMHVVRDLPRPAADVPEPAGGDEPARRESNL
ncbi:hypothetical protein ACRAKI_30555 [Saccharothrix isguenensis]